MNNWKKMRLGDVCTIERGGSPRPINDYITQEEDGINWIKIGDTKPNSMYITETKEKIRPSGVKKSRRVYKGDFLLSNSMSFGRPYILAIDGCIHDGWLVIRDENECFDKKFLYFYLGSPNVYAEFTRLAVGGVVNNLNSTLIKNLIVVIPSIAEQRNIAATLDKICETIADRKRQLEQLDLVVKSRFVEMFGEPDTNPMGLEMGTIDSVCASIVRGPFGSALKKEFFVEKSYDTYKVYEQKNAIQKNADIGVYHITSQKYEELRRFECRPDDFIMSCSGTIGELYQLPNEAERGIINQALCKFTLNDSMLPIVFLTYMKATIGNLESKGSSIKNIAAVSYIKKMPIPIPPLSLQEKFADFAQQANKIKIEIQQGLEKLELQYNALMQRYFG